MSVTATTDGVSLLPSALVMTVGLPPSMIATTELLVPRSMPMILLMDAPLNVPLSRTPASGCQGAIRPSWLAGPPLQDHALGGAERVADDDGVLDTPLGRAVADLVRRSAHAIGIRTAPRVPDVGRPQILLGGQSSQILGHRAVVEVVGLEGLLDPLQPVPAGVRLQQVGLVAGRGDPPRRERVRSEGREPERGGSDHHELECHRRQQRAAPHALRVDDRGHALDHLGELPVGQVAEDPVDVELGQRAGVDDVLDRRHPVHRVEHVALLGGEPRRRLSFGLLLPVEEPEIDVGVREREPPGRPARRRPPSAGRPSTAT